MTTAAATGEVPPEVAAAADTFNRKDPVGRQFRDCSSDSIHLRLLRGTHFTCVPEATAGTGFHLCTFVPQMWPVLLSSLTKRPGAAPTGHACLLPGAGGSFGSHATVGGYGMRDVTMRLADGLRRLRFTLLVGFVLCVVVCLPPRSGEPQREPQQIADFTANDLSFPDLASAARRGAIDSELVKALTEGETVDLFAILDGKEAADVYGRGRPGDIDETATVIARLRREVVEATDVQVLRTYDMLPELLVRVSTAESALRLLNQRKVLSLTQNRLNQHWLSASLPRINQPAVANGMHLTGRGVSIAVLDTGANLTLPNLGSCTAPGRPATCRVPAAFDAAPDDGGADTHGHGTNVTSIAAAVARDAKLIPIDVFGTDNLAADKDILAGVNWVMKNRLAYNVRAINMSLGQAKKYYTSNCGDAFFWRNPYTWPFVILRQAGVLPVVAAGNDATPGGKFQDGIAYPACTRGAVAVGATYSRSFGSTTWGLGTDTCTDSAPVGDAITCFSQDSPLVTLLAPGAQIRAGGSTMGGTSQATPHVSGAAAVLAEVVPSATGAELESFLVSSPTAVSDSRTGRVHPRLDLASAVRTAFVVANDDRSTARVLPRWGGQWEQATWTATKEPGEPNHAGNAGGASVWFRWTATLTGTATFSTEGSNYDTLLAAYQETPSGSLVQVAADNNSGNNSTSVVNFSVTAGDSVLLAVDGFRPSGAGGFTSSGVLKLTWNLPNDAISSALPLTAFQSTNGVNVGATHEYSEPHHCGDTFSSASVWYHWTPPIGATVRLRASGSQAICVAVYRAVGTSHPVNDFAALTPVTSGDDLGPYPIDLSFIATAGETYMIAVDGVSRETQCNPVTGQCIYVTPTGPFTLLIDY